MELFFIVGPIFMIGFAMYFLWLISDYQDISFLLHGSARACA